MNKSIISFTLALLVSQNLLCFGFEKTQSEELTKKYQDNPQAKATSVEELFFRGLVKQIQGNHEFAIEDYNKVLSLEADDQDTLANRCGLFTELEKYQNAIADCLKAISLGGENSDAIYFNLGLAQQQSGDFSSALKSFQEFRGYAQKNKDINLIEKADSRVDLIQRALKGQITKSSVNDYFKANDESLKGNLEQAANLYQRSIRISPNFAEAYLELANINAMQKNYDSAFANYKQAEKINPSLLAIYNNRAAVWIQYKKDYKSAKKDLKKAKSVAKDKGQKDVIKYFEEAIKQLE
ncbi:MAG: tetratricopeptide repeat protein [Candidatus Caenarcaniphilales bacterium]|nr:tetratricopeptide repeat protein [Candidatus Caenarcaniphilales bacterium]